MRRQPCKRAWLDKRLDPCKHEHGHAGMLCARTGLRLAQVSLPTGHPNAGEASAGVSLTWSPPFLQPPCGVCWDWGGGNGWGVEGSGGRMALTLWEDAGCHRSCARSLVHGSTSVHVMAHMRVHDTAFCTPFSHYPPLTSKVWYRPSQWPTSWVAVSPRLLHARM